MLVFCGFGCATHFMESCLRFLARQRKMPGFPTHIVGTPTIRGKARRYKDSRKDKDRTTSGKEDRPCHDARREERFLSTQADRFAGAEREEKIGLLRSKRRGGGGAP